MNDLKERQLYQDVEELKRKISQLQLPLDVVTAKLVKETITNQVSFYLKGIEPSISTNYKPFFIADKEYIVSAVQECHGVAGTAVGTVSLQLERLENGEAPDSGDELLKTAFNLKAAINTTQYGTLVDGDTIVIHKGDRLCAKDAGTLTTVGDLVLTVILKIL